MTDKKLTDNEIIRALECCGDKICSKCPAFSEDIECSEKNIKKAIDLITRQQAEIDEFMKETAITTLIDDAVVYTPTLEDYNKFKKKFKSESYKEFANKVDEILKRYAHLHKYADEARNNKEEYTDGTPMEMVSVWEVLSLKKWEMCDYEIMNTLQDNIENIAKERILTELEKDFMLLKKEMVGENNG